MSGIGLTTGRAKVGLIVAYAVVVLAGLAFGLAGAGGLLGGTRRERGKNMLSECYFLIQKGV
jgi:hypothetical protein